MKHSLGVSGLWFAAFAALILSAGTLFAARSGKSRDQVQKPDIVVVEESDSPAAMPEAAAEGTSEATPDAAPSEAASGGAEATPQPSEQADDNGRPSEPGDRSGQGVPGRDGRVMERRRVVPLDEALNASGKTDPIPLNQPDFMTADQVLLRGTYYKGNADESTIPVILLHKKDGKKEDWNELAQKLAESGLAVLVPDLRGYGESIFAYIEDYSFGGEPAIRPNMYNAREFGPQDWEAMRHDDGRFWFRFLVYLHNKKMLNLRKLVMVGDGYGACVAGCWLLDDWKATSPKKGQFTRGLLMISPESDEIFEKLGTGKTKAGRMSYKIVVGGLDKERLTAAEAIGLQLAKEKNTVEPQERKVPVENCKTERQSMPLLKASAFDLPEQILGFITEDCQSDETTLKWRQIKNFE
jgi:pimeloyl-ACP methyl ester carboxylesterase